MSDDVAWSNDQTLGYVKGQNETTGILPFAILEMVARDPVQAIDLHPPKTIEASPERDDPWIFNISSLYALSR